MSARAPSSRRRRSRADLRLGRQRERAQAFLEAVPSVDASRLRRRRAGRRGGRAARVSAYDAVGFTRLEMGGEGAAAAADAAKALKPPALSLGEGWRYLTNSIKLSPIPEGLKFGDVPPGVLQLGGTFLVKGGRVARAWADRARRAPGRRGRRRRGRRAGVKTGPAGALPRAAPGRWRNRLRMTCAERRLASARPRARRAEVDARDRACVGALGARISHRA